MERIRTVAVVGAGTMGQGIAQVCAACGFRTLLYDVDARQVQRALKSIDENLQVGISKGKWKPQEMIETLSRIQAASSPEELKADLIIEAAVERLDVKQDLFASLERINEGRAILATNTSSISINAIAGVLRDPSRCIGLHFFNPADRMKLVEIISGQHTASEIRETLQAFAKAIQKTAVRAKDSPGFIVNRVARPYYTESLKLLGDGAAAVPVIDRLLRASGFKMGPFELMDLIGVDINLSVTVSVFEAMGKPTRFTPSPIQQQLVRDGQAGRKSGKGFYDYAGKN